jgi:hypothetical protein
MLASYLTLKSTIPLFFSLVIQRFLSFIYLSLSLSHTHTVAASLSVCFLVPALLIVPGYVFAVSLPTSD